MSVLGRAVRAGDVARVKTLLREGVEVNSQDSRGRTPLQYACRSEHEDMQRIVDVLLDAGADVNAQDEDGQTPLHVSVQRISHQTKLEKNAAGGAKEAMPLAISSERNQVLVKTLLRKGVLVNVRDRNMRTALHCACMYEQETGQTSLHVAIVNNEIVKSLLANITSESSKERSYQHVVDRSQDRDKVSMVNSQDKDGNTALHLTCTRPSLTDDIMECVCLLLCAGAKVGVKNFREQTALHLAASYSRADVVDILLNKGVDVNATCWWGNTPLHEASAKGRTETVCLLLGKGAKVRVKNNIGKTALHMAAEYSGADIVDILLNNGEDVNATDEYGDTPLHDASWSDRNQIENVRCLLSKGAKVGVQNNGGKTALHRAACNGRADIVDILLNKGVDVNATCLWGNTPLLEASKSGQTETVRLLYRKGAKVGVKNNAGNTALHITAYRKRADTVDILLNNGEDVNATNKYGNTPLHEASESGHTRTVLLLLSKGAKVGVKNVMGQTPLHKATAFAAGDIVDVMVDHGEYVSAEDKYGNTPLHYLCKQTVMDTDLSLLDLSKAIININLLIIRGSKIDEQNIYGETPHEQIKEKQDNRMKTVETTLITQAIRLKTLGLQDKFDINWIVGPDIYDNVKFQCCHELESMKSTMVVKDIPLYQVFSHISQPFLVSTEDLQHIDEFLSSPDLLTRFPLYGDTLRITFQRAKLLTLAVQSFYSEQRKQMMKKIPCEVTEQLVNFLSNNDLRMFIESE